MDILQGQNGHQNTGADCANDLDFLRNSDPTSAEPEIHGSFPAHLKSILDGASQSMLNNSEPQNLGCKRENGTQALELSDNNSIEVLQQTLARLTAGNLDCSQSENAATTALLSLFSQEFMKANAKKPSTTFSPSSGSGESGRIDATDQDCNFVDVEQNCGDELSSLGQDEENQNSLSDYRFVFGIFVDYFQKEWFRFAGMASTSAESQIQANGQIWMRSAGRKKSHPVWTFFSDLRDLHGVGGVICLHCNWSGDDRSPNNLKTHLKRFHHDDGVYHRFTKALAQLPVLNAGADWQPKASKAVSTWEFLFQCRCPFNSRHCSGHSALPIHMDLVWVRLSPAMSRCCTLL
ncbi:BED zinc finger domain-containing protein [Ditylenchus destructor]|uniref:BED zinc finger domain-containing protein n=1 Tax=Ditylenchus destructor TaxID=166010 RepID=A0AAD4QYJ9_9BILA|nr:BED zinc finger domain-containing protein [Ditylenchus destructor]